MRIFKKYLLHAFLLTLLLVPLFALTDTKDTLNTAIRVIVWSTYIIVLKAIMPDTFKFQPLIFDEDIIYDQYFTLYLIGIVALI